MKAVVAILALALGGAGLSGAVLTGTLPLLQTRSAEEPVAGWNVLETFTGAAEGATGSLDLRTFWGNIQVVGWDSPTYEITVYERLVQSGQQVSDAGVEVQFEERAADEGLALSLQVVPTGSYDINLGHRERDYAVVANVPSAISWSTANICSGADGYGLGLRGALEPVLGVLWQRDEAKQEEGCITGQHPIRMNIGLMDEGSADSEEEVAEFPFSIAGISGDELMVHAQYADFALDSLKFSKAGLMTQYGDIEGNLEALELHAMTAYGDIGLTFTADALAVGSQYGDLHLQSLGGGPGAYAVGTQYGEVVLAVPDGLDRGYDVEAMTEYGEALIILDGVEFTSEEGDEGTLDLQAGLPALGKAAPLPGKPSRDHTGADKGVAAKSEHFDGAPIQVVIKALAEYGDVLVTNGLMPEAEEDDDQA